MGTFRMARVHALATQFPCQALIWIRVFLQRPPPEPSQVPQPSPSRRRSVKFIELPVLDTAPVHPGAIRIRLGKIAGAPPLLLNVGHHLDLCHRKYPELWLDTVPVLCMCRRGLWSGQPHACMRRASHAFSQRRAPLSPWRKELLHWHYDLQRIILVAAEIQGCGRRIVCILSHLPAILKCLRHLTSQLWVFLSVPQIEKMRSKRFHDIVPPLVMVSG